MIQYFKILITLIVAILIGSSSGKAFDFNPLKKVNFEDAHFDHKDPLDISFNPDGKMLITTPFGEVRFWSADDGKHIPGLTLQQDFLIESAVFSPNGKMLVTVGCHLGNDYAGKKFKLWDLATNRSMFEQNEPYVNIVVFSLDNTMLFSGSNGHVSVWDIATGKKLREITGSGTLTDASSVSPDGTNIVTFIGPNAHIFNVYDGQLVSLLKNDGYHVKSAIFSPDGSKIVTTYMNHTAKVWDAETGKYLFDLIGHNSCFSADSKKVMTALTDKTVKVWDASDGKSLLNLDHSAEITDLAFSPDDNKIVTSSRFRSFIRIWDANDGRLLFDLRNDNPHTTTGSVSFSPDGKSLLSSSCLSTHLWLFAPDELVKPTSLRLLCYIKIIREFMHSGYSITYEKFLDFLSKDDKESRKEIKAFEKGLFSQLGKDMQIYLRLLIPGRPQPKKILENSKSDREKQ